MALADKEFKRILRYVLDNGVEKETRSGLVKSCFGMTARFNIGEELPLLTIRKVFTRGIIEELLWFLSGSTNIKPLVEHDVNIWTDDAWRYYNERINNCVVTDGKVANTKDDFIKSVINGDKCTFINGESYTFGDLGPVYGKNWRSFGINGIDQVAKVIDTLKTNPNDRRMLITGYNPDDVGTAALPPCHLLYQFYTSPMTVEDVENWKLSHKDQETVPTLKLSCSLYCRSQDFLLGTVFNWVSASILTAMIAEVVGMGVGELVWFGGDVHVYMNQIEAADELLKRLWTDCKPRLCFARRVKGIDDFEASDVIIKDYHPQAPIKIPLSVG